MTFKHIENASLQGSKTCYTKESPRCQKFQVSLLIISFLWMLCTNGLLTDTLASEETVADDEISVLAVGDITVSSRMTPLIERKGAGVFLKAPPP